MERFSYTAIEIINELHTERLDYSSEYIPLIDAANRLSAYEDTGLEPEEINDMALEVATLKTIESMYDGLGNPDHLRDLLQAEKDGRLVVLPCKVGELVWTANNRCGVCSHKIWRIERNNDGDFACSLLMFPFCDFGKTVFLTREEAEAALAQKGGDG